jgi:hypothetical protein
MRVTSPQPVGREGPSLTLWMTDSFFNEAQNPLSFKSECMMKGVDAKRIRFLTETNTIFDAESKGYKPHLGLCATRLLDIFEMRSISASTD